MAEAFCSTVLYCCVCHMFVWTIGCLLGQNIILVQCYACSAPPRDECKGTKCFGALWHAVGIVQGIVDCSMHIPTIGYIISWGTKQKQMQQVIGCRGTPVLSCSNKVLQLPEVFKLLAIGLQHMCDKYLLVDKFFICSKARLCRVFFS